MIRFTFLLLQTHSDPESRRTKVLEYSELPGGFEKNLKKLEKIFRLAISLPNHPGATKFKESHYEVFCSKKSTVAPKKVEIGL